MKRENFSSGTIWEPKVGYSRAVKMGQFVFISGTTATDNNGQIVGKGDPYLQTKQILKNIENVLEEAGGNLNDVVRTRIYVTDINDWEKIGKAHAEFFANIRPASTMVEVNKLVNSDMLVEIDVDAVIV